MLLRFQLEKKKTFFLELLKNQIPCMYNRIWFESGISKEITSICCWKVRSFNNRLQKWILFCSWILSLWIRQKCIFFAYFTVTGKCQWLPFYRSGVTYLEKGWKISKSKCEILRKLPWLLPNLTDFWCRVHYFYSF